MKQLLVSKYTLNFVYFHLTILRLKQGDFRSDEILDLPLGKLLETWE